MDLHHLWGGPFAVHKVIGNLSVLTWCKIIIWWSFASRNLRDIYRLQGFGTQIELTQIRDARALVEKGSPTSLWGEKRPWGALATVSTTGSHNGEPQGNHRGEPPKKENETESKIKDFNSSWNWKVSSWATSFNNRFQDIQWIISKSLQWYLDICFQCLFRKKCCKTKISICKVFLPSLLKHSVDWSSWRY